MEDQFEYNDTEFIIEIADGSSFSKLCAFFKNGGKALIRLTKNSMNYRELKLKDNEKVDESNRVSLDIICDFDVTKFKTYTFISRNEEYDLYIDAKELADKFKKVLKNTPIKMIKRNKDDRIYITVGNNGGVAHLQPLVMQTAEDYNNDYKYRGIPNCFIEPSRLHSHC